MRPFDGRLAWIAILLASYAAAAESVSTDSPDYRLQGEFAGLGFGVQIVARGEGRFEAQYLPGGLPGAGFRGQGQIAVQGRLSTGAGEPSVRFEFPNGWLHVEPEQALWHDWSDRQLGVLSRRRRQSPTRGLKPPSHATRLFVDGQIGELEDAKLSDDGFLARGAKTLQPVGDFRLHVEYRTPFTPKASGQGRGNSGVYIQRRYEVQILDSFGRPPGDASEAGGLYRQTPGALSMSLPPLTWQTYDIWFEAAKFGANGTKLVDARVTVVHNGVAVHDRRRIDGKTGAGQKEGPDPLPILFQDHGDNVVFDNVWIVHGERRASASVDVSTPSFVDVVASPWATPVATASPGGTAKFVFVDDREVDPCARPARRLFRKH